jgi:phage shock protein E
VRRKAEKRNMYRVVLRLSSCAVFALLLCVVPVSLTLSAAGATQEEPLPLWWPDKLKQAESAGYGLITPRAVEVLMQGNEPFKLLDVRPDYEFAEGHIPGALNLEFNLGHRSNLQPEHATAMKALLGPDLDQKIIVYCRNFK